MTVARVLGRRGEAPTPPASTESIRGDNRTALVRPGTRAAVTNVIRTVCSVLVFGDLGGH